MGEKLDRMRAAQGKVATKPPPPVVAAAKTVSSTGQTLNAAAAEQPAKPKEKGATVRHSCGHEESLGQLQRIPCPDCVSKNKKEKLARKRAKDAAKKEAAGKPSFKRKIERLPAGSYFDCLVYEGETQTWRGELHVPTGPGPLDRVKFSSRGISAVFTLLADLDTRYRHWLAQQQAPAAPTT